MNKINFDLIIIKLAVNCFKLRNAIGIEKKLLQISYSLKVSYFLRSFRVIFAKISLIILILMICYRYISQRIILANNLYIFSNLGSGCF